MNHKHAGVPLYIFEVVSFLLLILWLLILVTYQMYSISLFSVDIEDIIFFIVYSTPIWISFTAFRLYECSDDRGRTVVILLWISLICAIPYNLLSGYKAFQFVYGNPFLGPAAGCGILFLCELIHNPKLRLLFYTLFTVLAIYALSQINTECTSVCAALIPIMYLFRNKKLLNCIVSEIVLIISSILFQLFLSNFSQEMFVINLQFVTLKSIIPALVAIPVLLCLPVNNRKKIPGICMTIACPVLFVIIWLTRNL